MPSVKFAEPVEYFKCMFNSSWIYVRIIGVEARVDKDIFKLLTQVVIQSMRRFEWKEEWKVKVELWGFLTIEGRAKEEKFKSRACNFSVLGILGEISVLSTRDMDMGEGMGSNVTRSQEDRKNML